MLVCEDCSAVNSSKIGHRWTFSVPAQKVVPRRGIEPLTCPLGGDCAIQLCHRGIVQILTDFGIIVPLSYTKSTVNYG